MGRGVLWMVWGDGWSSYGDALQRSIASLKRFNPDLPYHVEHMPLDSTVLCKARMYELSPFEETLFLDADTVVLGKLDYGFSQARRNGIACCISANPWQRRYHSLWQNDHDATEYSSGVVFFVKTFALTGRVFDDWRTIPNSFNTVTRYVTDDGKIREQAHNDQALFTLSMEQNGFSPTVLPQNWNLCPRWQKSFFGPVKIWHGTDTVPASLLAWNEEQSREGAVIKAAQLA